MNQEGGVSFCGVKPSRRCTPTVAIQNSTNQIGDRSDNARSPKSVLLVLELTRWCNLMCTHCYVSASKQVIDQGLVSEDTWLHCMKKAKEQGILKIQFIGGEVTLHSSLHKLVEQAGELKFSDVELFSNATMIGSELVAVMRQNRVRLATSLYGPTAERHDGVTMVRGSFKRTCSNIERALAAGIDTRVGIVGNNGDSQLVEDTRLFAQGLGVRQISADVVRAFGRGKECGSTTKGCDSCGKSVLRVCSDGEISGCSMSRKPLLGNVNSGIVAALETLVAGTSGSATCH